MIFIDYEVRAGDEFISLMKKLIQYIKDNQTDFYGGNERFMAFKVNFNNVLIHVFEGSTPKSLYAIYNKELDRKYEEWKNSEEGKKYEIDRIIEREYRQYYHSILMEELKNFNEYSDEERVGWLEEYTKFSYNIYIENNYSRVIEVLESCGYVRNKHVGDPPESFNEPVKMLEYIFGQVLNFSYIKMPPNPITLTFIGSYRKLCKV